MSEIVAISGKSGCGNSTVSKLVAEKLGFTLVNYTFKNLAEDEGLSFEEVMRRSSQEDHFDRTVDARQVEEAKKGRRVVGSRLAIWMIGETADLKVYLWASPAVRASRIHDREGNALYGVPEYTRERDLADHARYARLYGIDNDDYTGVDLVINTERLLPEAIAELIVTAYHLRRGSGGAR